MRGRRLPLPRPVSPFRSVGGRLALALLVVVAGVLAIVYLIVVPSYRSSLENNELRGARALAAHDRDPELPGRAVPEAAVRARRSAPQVNARVVVFDLQNTMPALLEPVADSDLRDGLDATSRTTRSPSTRSSRQTLARGTVTRGGQTYAEVAYPIGGSVVLLSGLAARPAAGRLRRAPPRLRSPARSRWSSRSCSATRARALFARRIRRLELAADRIAAGQLRRAGRRPRLGRARPARPLVRADAAAARAPRPGPRRVHRQRLARAAHAALLARRLPGAARRPGARRGDARRVPRADARAGRPPDEARDRPARPLAARRRPAGGRAGADRPRASSPTSSARSSAPARRRVAHPLELAARSRRSSRSATPSACCRSAGSWSRTRSCTRRPGRRCGSARALDGSRATLTVANDGPGIPRRRPAADLRALLPARRRPRLGQRPRPGDRPRAGRGDGRPDRARLAERLDAVHARALADADVGALVAAE